MKRIVSIILALALLTLGVPFTVSAAETQDGLVYEIKNGEVTITGYIGIGYPANVSIPSVIEGKPVTSIGYDAFYGCWNLTSITIPDSVTSIGDSAFDSCESLTSITIPDSVTSIGDEAFRNCESLTSITILDGVTSIGDYAFYGCKLTSITIPKSVTSIKGSSFCSNPLKSINVDENNSSYMDVDGVLFNKNQTQLILYPQGKTSEKYSIPNGVTSIGNYAFYGCWNLTSITIPDSVTSIGRSAFEGCTSLTSITIPDGVTSIGRWAFSDCTRLTSITIPDSVTSIGDRAFENCPWLVICGYEGSVAQNYAKTWSIPFEELPKPEFEYDNINGKLVITGYSGSATEIVIPSSIEGLPVTAVSDDFLCGNTTITSVVIPEGVKSIGSLAFEGCKRLKSVSLPEGLLEIGMGAFSDCYSLSEVYIPESVTSMGKMAFDNCSDDLVVRCFAKTSVYDYLVKNGISYKVVLKYLGDISGDYEVSTLDALKILQGAVGCTTLDDEQRNFADVNNDNALTSEDALLVLQYSVELIDKFPVEQ